MKKLVFILAIAALLGACKKTSSGPKETLLSKVIMNGEIESEFIYNSDRQLAEERNYKFMGVNTLNLVYKYSYEGGRLKEMNYYKQPGNKLTGKYVYTVDDLGRITRSAVYSMSGADSGKLATYVDNEYNPAGRVSKQSWRDEAELLNTTRELTYYPNGNMRTSETFNYYNGFPEKIWGSSYGDGDTTLPASFYNVKAYPLNYYLNYLVTSYIKNFTYDKGQVSAETHEIVSSREFNAKGMITKLTVTTKHIKPVAPDEVMVMQFEYVEL